jgi:ubiquitin-protein ligase
VNGIRFVGLGADAPQGISAAPEDNNILKWGAVIFGPDGTPWEVTHADVNVSRFDVATGRHVQAVC